MRIEKLTTLSLSIYSNKGAYALLLGFGISRKAHIPAGWDVEERLIEQIAATQKNQERMIGPNGILSNMESKPIILIY